LFEKFWDSLNHTLIIRNYFVDGMKNLCGFCEDKYECGSAFVTGKEQPVPAMFFLRGFPLWSAPTSAGGPEGEVVL
jgi:hypothetical protein